MSERQAYHPLTGGTLGGELTAVVRFRGLIHVYLLEELTTLEGTGRVLANYETADLIGFESTGAIRLDKDRLISEGLIGGTLEAHGGRLYGYALYKGSQGYSLRHYASQDGRRFRLLQDQELPADGLSELSSPQIAFRDGRYQLVFAAADSEGLPCLAAYESADARHWKPSGRRYFREDPGKLAKACFLGNSHFVIQAGREAPGFYAQQAQSLVRRCPIDLGSGFASPLTMRDGKREVLFGLAGGQPTLPRDISIIHEQTYQFPVSEILNKRTLPTRPEADRFTLSSPSGIRFAARKPFRLSFGPALLAYDGRRAWLSLGGKELWAAALDQPFEAALFLADAHFELFINNGATVLTLPAAPAQPAWLIINEGSLSLEAFRLPAFRLRDGQGSASGL